MITGVLLQQRSVPKSIGDSEVWAFPFGSESANEVVKDFMPHKTFCSKEAIMEKVGRNSNRHAVNIWTDTVSRDHQEVFAH